MRLKSLAYNITFAVNCLLVFLLIAESYMQVPVVVQVFGRMHPLFLHIPIGVFLLYAIFEIVSTSRTSHESVSEIKEVLLLTSAFTIALTALMGIFLAREAGYQSDLISLHKWLGAFTSILVLAWYQFRKQLTRKFLLKKIIAGCGIVLIILTGHMGGNITHGENFVLAPILPEKEEKPPVPFEEAVVYTHIVQPIIEEKCVSCHNQRKAKGELVMETSDLLLKGGKNGQLWDTTAADLGIMLQRIHLPLDDEDHMPPKGKPQLTEMEKSILEEWIRSGSSFTVKVSELKAEDPLLALSKEVLNPDQSDQYTFQSASASTVQSLNNFYRLITPVAENSPALSIRFFGSSQFQAEKLQELQALREQVIEMDLARMPLKDEHLVMLKQFPNLRKLNLNFTNIDGSGLSQLKGLTHLRELSLSGTAINAQALQVLEDFTGLKKVYVWNTSVLPEEAMRLQKQTGATYEAGYNNDTAVLKLPPVTVQHEQFILTEPVALKLKHNINGAIIRYTTDGSDPDSLDSPVYKGDVKIEKALTVKTKVFREGWQSSDIKSTVFYFSSLKPDRVKLLTSPNPKYTGTKERTLFDRTLGGTNFGNGSWLGYQFPSAFDVMLAFDSPPSAKKVTLSSYAMLPAHIFPPSRVNVWYGNDSLNMKKLGTRTFAVPKKDDSGGNLSISFDLPGEAFRFIRIEAVPLAKLPAWHDSKGSPAWVFVDEVLIE